MFLRVVFLLVACLSFGLSSAQDQTPLTAETIFKKCSPSVAKVSTAKGEGTGFLFQPGFLVTAAHVIEGASEISVEFSDGIKAKVESVISYNRKADFALLYLKTSGETRKKVMERAMPWGDYDALQTGETIYVIGNPAGLDFSITQGIVSAKRMFEGLNKLQVSATASIGSSGSPVLNKFGEVVGLISSGFGEGTSLNLAVPVSEFQSAWGIKIGDFFRKDNSYTYTIGPDQAESFKDFKKSLQNLETAYSELIEVHKYFGFDDQGYSDKTDELSKFFNEIHRDYRIYDLLRELRIYFKDRNDQISQLDFIRMFNLVVQAERNTFGSVESVLKRKPQYKDEINKQYDNISVKTIKFSVIVQILWIDCDDSSEFTRTARRQP
jgi:hypothetical protein